MMTIAGTDRDSCLLLKDGSVVEVLDMCTVTNKYRVLKYKGVENVFTEPFPSLSLGISLVSSLDVEPQLIDPSSVLYKCYRLPFNSSFVAVPLVGG